MPPTPESLEGSAAHAAIASCLTNGFDPLELIGRFFVVGDTVKHRIEVTPEMGDAITPFVDDVRADMAQGARVFIEHKFTMPHVDSEAFGTCDAITYFPALRLLRMREYKHGAGVFVEVEGNKQMRYYGNGAMMALGLPVERVELCVYQPNFRGVGEPARSCEVDPGELFEFGGELVDIIAAARKPDAPLNPGDHCQFCNARGGCPALYDAALKAAGADVEPNTGEFLAPLPPELLTMAELGQRLSQAGILRTWLNGVRAYALAEMNRGNVAAGHKPVHKKGHRRWKDAELTARQAVLAMPGVITEDDMYSRRIITPAAFERLVGKQDAAEFVDAYAERPKGLTLVELSDKREAVPVGALSEFEVIGETEHE